ncbi:hypothetical protein [Roseisolibacter agri]|uniref:Uncharacterized protein n=1 Tax=Roseisolibacter agri TaxID=2014610 RepID=A0AA37QIU3_9BACT|nr:hypothetical protein [Roseisolibacter agri]GLC27648.1 hypothetical protein rosag_41610 [Roseisolibacter agri]
MTTYTDPAASPTPSVAPSDPPADAARTGTESRTDARTDARGEPREHRRAADPLNRVRASDLEPYTGLGYLSKLFRLIAILLLVLLVAEVGIGMYSEGVESLRTLTTEASRLIVIAGVLWGAGDLATLLIDIGHDVRATRILLGRQALPPGETLAPSTSATTATTATAAAPHRPTALPRRTALGDAPEVRADARME